MRVPTHGEQRLDFGRFARLDVSLAKVTVVTQQRPGPEPVFGIVKSVLGFRQFLLRGLDKVKGEWSLVTMAWNLKRMFVLRAA